MVTFHNVRLPEEIEMGARGGLGFKTTILESNSGREQRNIEWSRARGRWDISYGIRNKADLIAVRDFHLARYGRAYGFRFKDWLDYVMPRQTIAVGTGAVSSFPVFKEYSSGGFVYRSYLTRIVANSYSLWIGGVLQGISDFNLDIDVGTVTTPAAPGVGVIVEFACQFDRPVRFDIDRMEIQGIIAENKEDTDQTAQTEGVEGITAVPIVELRE